MVSLGKDFSVSNKILTDMLIYPKTQHGGELQLFIQNDLIEQGKTSISEYIKVFISAEKFDTNTLNRPSISILTQHQRGIGSRSTFHSQRDWDKQDIAVKTVIMTLKLKLKTAFSQYSNRKGFNELFFDNYSFRISLDNILKNHANVLVPLKEATTENKHLLHYSNFSVATHKERHMPILVAVNIDLSKQIDINKRFDTWIVDPRIDEGYQLHTSIYSKNNLDLGRLVRRLDTAWGENAIEANQDTFHLTTCVPQNRKLNRIEWLGLEDKIFKSINSKSDKISVLTGPVFSTDDTLIDSILLPMQFWKIIAMVNKNELIVKGYLLSHRDLINNLSKSQTFDKDNFGEYKVYEVPLSKIAELTNLCLDDFYPYDPLHIVEVK
jgi:endonuclease G, mitochondrial